MTGGSESFVIASRSQITAVAQNSDQSPLIAKAIYLDVFLSLARSLLHVLCLGSI